MERIEFGVARSKCACTVCKTNCRFMPGFLIPLDLERMIPVNENPMHWAEKNLLASPGAKVIKGDTIFRIHTLVPAVKKDGSCINLSPEGLCMIHENAPFGCAFFDCRPDIDPQLSSYGLREIVAGGASSLYNRIWERLDLLGKRQVKAEILRQKIAKALGVTKY